MSFFSKSPILQIRDFRLVILARWSISMAMQIQSVIVGWEIYRLRADTLLLGLLGLAEALPAIGCSFFSGHVVDNHRPAFIYRMALFTLLVNSSILFLATLPQAPLSTDQRILIIFCVVFVSGLVRSFAAPASFALWPLIVPRQLYSAASAWSSSAFQFAAIIGPILGGLAYGWIGSVAAFALIPTFCLMSFLSASLWSAETKTFRSDHARENFLKSIQVGIRFVFKERVLLSTMTLDMFSVLFGGATQILPAYAANVLGIGAAGLGILRAAPSIGSLFVALRLALRPLRVISGKTLMVVVAGFGVCIVGFGLSTNFFLSVAFLAASGAFDGVSMVIRQTILQLLTPDQMRGRVSAVSTVFITSSNEIGAFESGLAARLLGLVPSVVFGGAMALFVVGVMAKVFPELRRTRISH